jgi:hypothetical protein
MLPQFLGFILNMEAECSSETSETLATFTPCKDTQKQVQHPSKSEQVNERYLKTPNDLDFESSVFWDISCSPLNVNRRFGGTCRLHLQG